MKELQQQGAEELVTLTEAEVEAVSGAMVVDMGILGVWKIRGECMSITMSGQSETYTYAYCLNG